MSTIKNIFIIHQQGMEPLVPYVQTALNEVLDCFSQYKQYFPITNLGNWKSENPYVWQNGRFELSPYESFEWYLDRAKQRSIQEERWQKTGQINIEQMAQDLWNDPYREQIPQWSIHLTNYDLYGGAAQGFCLGFTMPNAFSIISTNRFLNRNNSMGLENFLTTVQHEFGHILGVTEGNRPNTYESLGPHCSTRGCIMQQRENGDVSDLTQARLQRKALGKPTLCPHCITQGRKNLFKLYSDHEKKNRPFNLGGPYGPNGGRD